MVHSSMVGHSGDNVTCRNSSVSGYPQEEHLRRSGIISEQGQATASDVKLVGDDKTRFTITLSAKIEAARSDSSERIGALLLTALQELRVRAVCKLLN